MKRLVAMILSVLLILTSFSAFADTRQADEMEKTLIKVKQKISVPDELTEFSGNTSVYNDKTNYNFTWRTEDYEKSLMVASDSEGRITSYYDNYFKGSDKKISSVTMAEIIKYAQDFIAKTLPETFIDENDRLFYDSYTVSENLTYTLSFKRLKNSVFVKDNYVTITLCVCDDSIFVRRMNVNFKYDASFDEEKEKTDNITEKYKELFPVELIYRDEYVLYTKLPEHNKNIKLIYRIKDDNIGYMDISNGEILTEDPTEDEFRKEFGSAEDSVMNGASGGGLTQQEIKELENIEGLLSVEEIEKEIKKLPYLNFTDELKIENQSLYKDQNDDYFYSLSYAYRTDEKERYLFVRVYAKDGELISLNNNDYFYDGERKALSEEQTKDAEVKIKEFLDKAAKEKLSQTTEIDREDNYASVNSYFERILNGVKYEGNGISITFDTKSNIVTHYSVNFTKGEFDSPQDAIDKESAYEKILEYSPITEIYILNDGIYKKAVTLEKTNISLDALTGEIQNPYYTQEYSYSDIEDHWISDAATKLSQIQVGLNGEKLEPEKEITQEDFLRLVAQGVYGNYYSQYSADELYDMLTNQKIINDNEKAPDSSVNREDAFVYIIRFAGLEKVAKLSEIFKVNFADENKLTKEKKGYAAILSGMKVVCGDGGNLRPLEKLTRAEAISLVYKYLLTF